MWDAKDSSEGGNGRDQPDWVQILTVRLSDTCVAAARAVLCSEAVFKRIIAVQALLHGYIAWRLLPDLPQPGMVWTLGLYLLLSCALVPMALVHRRLARPPHAQRLAWAGFGALGLFSALLMLTVLRDLLVGLASGLWPPLGTAWGLAIEPWAWSAQAVPVLALLLSAWGMRQAHRTPPVRPVRIPIADLAPGLQGLKIVQISDVHVGPTIQQDFVQRLVQQVNALDADVVAITGDLVDGPVAELLAHLAPLSKLQARHGCFFVTGNHEYYAGCHPWLPEFKRLGLRVLLNEHEVLELSNHGQRARLVLAGVTDWAAHRFDATHRSDPRAALKGAPAQADLRLLLAHQPRSAAAAEEAGFDVQLSGHTHGGQLWPWIYLVYLQQPYLAGLRRHGRLWVYTSRGSGYWGPPQRLGAPSEVTLITLESAAVASSRPRLRARHSVRT